ncbi:SusC/RagA family TonB-linked outer membrane protein [Robiginitalea sp. SC105]|uniref:SusC/RagA family TonB-linked outer membrane protein n=1 Tax=Robiginitalea sp. SC105 TaxID=2762332 RepID=UPI00351CAC83
MLIFSGSSVWTQEKIITGQVRDNFNQPLPGANVVVQGTGRGTITNFDGDYQIQAAEGETLVFSYVGFNSRQIQVAVATTLNVTLLPGYNLDEVLLIGYGTATRAQLTDNIAVINSDQIEEIPVTSLQGTLAGKAAGVQIEQIGGRAESGFRIRVRGGATISGSQEPLYVLDGIPLQKADFSIEDSASPINDLIALNPADIESVEILKDASAAAIYGSRATNGVVLINTKSGRKGETRFSLQTAYGWSEPTSKLDWLNTKEYVELYTEAALNSGWTEAEIAAFFNSYARDEADWREGRVDTDWEDLASVSGSIYDLNFSAAGGGDKTTFYLSTGYNNTQGIVLGNAMERYSLRARIEHQAKDWLTLGVISNLSKTQLSRVENDRFFGNPYTMVSQIPFSRPYEEDGVTPNTNTLVYNALMDQYNGEFETNIWRGFAKLHLEAYLARNLNFRSEFGYDYTDQLEERFWGSLSQAAAVDGFGDALDVKEEKYVLNNYFGYRFDTEDWDFDATLGMSYEELLVKGLYLEGQNFPSDQLRKLDSAGEITGGYSSEWRASLVSYFARFSATLLNRWLFKASLRMDGSSRFGMDSQYGTFPAASLGWIASNEPFLRDSRTLSNLKLRVSWGITGNSNTNPFASKTQFGIRTYNQEPGFVLDRLGDPALSWEETSQYNFGADFGLFGNRLNTSLDYYVKSTRDLLFSTPIPVTNGWFETERNTGKIRNSGLEWTLDSQNIISENFTWNTSFNLAFNRNRVIALPNGADITNILRLVREGEALASFYMVEYAGVDPDNGNALFYRNTVLPDGSLDRSTTTNWNEANRRVVGNPFPDVFGGMTHNLRFGGIDFSFTLQGQWGAQIYNPPGKWQSSNANVFNNQTRDQLNRWQQPGDITNVPQARLFGGNGNQESTRYLQDADFIRLRNATLGYTLPASVAEKAGMDRVRVYLTGVNLLTFTDFTGRDPESTADFLQGASLLTGATYNSPPPARTITLGFNIDF